MRLLSKASTCFFGGVAALFLMAGAAHAGDIFVIANEGLSIQDSDIVEVFNGDKQSVGGVKVVPVDNQGAQNEFLSKVLNVDRAKYGAAWRKKSFREGINPPDVKSSDADVVSFVKSTPGAVGYVTSSPSGVKIVKKY